MTALFTTTCDWRVSDLVTIFSIGIVVLGLSAALFGGWLEKAGPRKAGLAPPCAGRAGSSSVPSGSTSTSSGCSGSAWA